MEKKNMPVVEKGHHVIIPVGIKGAVYENAEYLLDLVTKWETEHPKQEIVGTPNFNITPSSSGRGVTIDSISFSWKTKPRIGECV